MTGHNIMACDCGVFFNDRPVKREDHSFSSPSLPLAHETFFFLFFAVVHLRCEPCIFNAADYEKP